MSVRFKNARVSKNMPLDVRIQWNAGTACVSERVLKNAACWGLRVGPSKRLLLCKRDLVDVSDIFIFFRSGEGKERGRFSLKIPGGGVPQERGGGGAEGPGRCLRGIGGGGGV